MFDYTPKCVHIHLYTEQLSIVNHVLDIHKALFIS